MSLKYTDFHLNVHFIHRAHYINLLDASSVHLQIILPQLMLITSVDMAQEQMFKQHGIGFQDTQGALVTPCMFRYCWQLWLDKTVSLLLWTGSIYR